MFTEFLSVSARKFKSCEKVPLLSSLPRRDKFRFPTKKIVFTTEVNALLFWCKLYLICMTLLINASSHSFLHFKVKKNSTALLLTHRDEFLIQYDAVHVFRCCSNRPTLLNTLVLFGKSEHAAQYTASLLSLYLIAEFNTQKFNW